MRVPPTTEPVRLLVVEGGAAFLDCRVRAAYTPTIRVGRDFYRMVESPAAGGPVRPPFLRRHVHLLCDQPEGALQPPARLPHHAPGRCGR